MEPFRSIVEEIFRILLGLKAICWCENNGALTEAPIILDKRRIVFVLVVCIYLAVLIA